MAEKHDITTPDKSKVDRASAPVPNLSSQPRNANGDAVDSFFVSTFEFAKAASLADPAYSVDSRRRDKWLRRFWKREPHLGGVIKSVLDIDKNRGWSVIGGRNQVARVRRVLHSVENNSGWRYFFSQQALSYYATDMGSITELGRDGEDGPLRTMYHVDSARCRLNSSRAEPLSYYPVRGRMQKWVPGDYFRTTSIPSDDEKYLGLGWCAVSRALEFAKIMVGVFMHDAEELGAMAMEGLLLLNNISQEQWNDAMRSREAELEGKERMWFNGVGVIASAGVEQVDAKLVALSSLPSNFDRATFVEGMMLGYALIFGYDINEFWSTSGGSFGRGSESEIQARKASGKGSLDFILGYQDRLQDELPNTVHFEFDNRNPEGDLLMSQQKKEDQTTITGLYESGLSDGVSLISRDEARKLLAAANIIPEEWIESPDDNAIVTDVSRLKEKARETDAVLRAATAYPSEPIVRYSWEGSTGGKTTVLWHRGDEVFRPTNWSGVTIPRQESDGILFESGDVVITEDDVDDAILASRRRNPQLADILENEPATAEEEEEILEEHNQDN